MTVANADYKKSRFNDMDTDYDIPVNKILSTMSSMIIEFLHIFKT